MVMVKAGSEETGSGFNAMKPLLDDRSGNTASKTSSENETKHQTQFYFKSLFLRAANFETDGKRPNFFPEY